MNVRGLSDETLKELHENMDKRRKSCAENPREEAEYETKSSDWQEMFGQIEAEMKRRGLA